MQVSDLILNYLKYIDFETMVRDFFMLVFFVITALIYGFFIGRDRIAMILVSIYMALAVVTNAPFIKNFAQVTVGGFFIFRTIIFISGFLFIFFLLSHSGLLKNLGKSGSRGNWWQIILFSFLHVGLLISVVLSFLPSNVVGDLAPITRSVFVSDLSRLFWLIVPIVAMIVVQGKKR